MNKVYIDQIDADADGYDWLEKVAVADGCTCIKPVDLAVDGRLVVAWKHNFPYAFFMVLRNDNNYSNLIKGMINGNEVEEILNH